MSEMSIHKEVYDKLNLGEVRKSHQSLDLFLRQAEHIVGMIDSLAYRPVYHGTSLSRARQILIEGLKPHFTGAPLGTHVCVAEKLTLAQIFAKAKADRDNENVAVVFVINLPLRELVHKDTMWGCARGGGPEWAGRAWRIPKQIPASDLEVAALLRRQDISSYRFRNVGAGPERLRELISDSVRISN